MKKLIILFAILFGTVSVYAEGTVGCTPPTSNGCQTTGTGQIIGTVKCPLSIDNADRTIEFVVGARSDWATIDPQKLTFKINSCLPADAITEGTIKITCSISRDIYQPKNHTILKGTWNVKNGLKTQNITTTDNYDVLVTDFTEIPMAMTIPVSFTLTEVNGTNQDIITDKTQKQLKWTLTVTAIPEF